METRKVSEWYVYSLIGLLLCAGRLGFGAEPVAPTYNILDYGAVSNEVTENTPAIQKAIDVCADDGGGIVLIPPGRFLTGSITLKTGVTLHLAEGATLLGSQDLSDYPTGSLISAQKAYNIGITGTGTINGQGAVFWQGKERPYHRPDRLIRFENCQKIHIKDITLTNSPNWTCELRQCRWVWVEGITILNDRNAPNTDGIDPVSSSNIFISDCYINTGDDCIVPKSSANGPCENIVVDNCILVSDDSALKLGTGSDHAIRNFLVSNTVIRNTHYGIAFFMKDGGTYEDVQFSNITIETTRLTEEQAQTNRGLYPIFMDIEQRTPDSPLGTIRNVVFQNISIVTQNGNCLFQGWEGHPIEDLTFRNVRLRVLSRTDFSGRTKPRGTRTLTEKAANDYARVSANFTFANIRGLTIDGLTIDDESGSGQFERHGLWGMNIADASIRGFRSVRKVHNKHLAEISLNNARNILITASQASQPDVPFLWLGGTRTADVSALGNDLSISNHPFQIGAGVDNETFYENGNRIKQR